MPVLFFRPSVIQLIDFTHLNLFVAMGLFQKSEPFFDLRHLIDNFCHLFRAERKAEEARKRVSWEAGMPTNRALHYAGRPAEAIQLLEKALRLNPMPDSFELYGLGNAYIDTGQYEEAIAACKKAIKIAPKNQWAHVYLTSAYSLSGREQEGRAELEEVLRIDPKFSLAHFAKISQFKN